MHNRITQDEILRYRRKFKQLVGKNEDRTYQSWTKATYAVIESLGFSDHRVMLEVFPRIYRALDYYKHRYNDPEFLELWNRQKGW